MEISRMPGTQHIDVDVAALKAFLLEQHFAPSFVEDLHLIFVPLATSEEIDDALFDEYNTARNDVWVCTKDRSSEQLNCDLLRALRQEPYEFCVLPCCGESLTLFEAHGVDIADQKADVARFVERFAHRQFLTFDETVCSSLEEVA
jgi:hypothetical protein